MPTVEPLRPRPDLRFVTSGWSMLVTDAHGRLGGDAIQGFYVDNTRFISRELLLVRGKEPVPFSTARVGAHAQLSYACVVDGEGDPAEGLYLALERFVGPGLHTRLTLLSSAHHDQRVDVRVELEADFLDVVDLLEGKRSTPVPALWDQDSQRLTLSAGGPLQQSLRLHPTGALWHLEDGALCTVVDVPARQDAVLSLFAEAVTPSGRRRAPAAAYTEPRDAAGAARAHVRPQLTALSSTVADVAVAWRTAVADLADLALGEPAGPTAPIAGVPLYQQVFGRDTLTASWQALLATPTLLRDSLLLNASLVGTRVDDWRDEEPGKLLHQARRGPRSVLGEDPLDRYYGDFATGPDFLVFLGQYYAWTGDTELLRELLPVARKVLDWLDRYADSDGDGFLDYRTRSTRGVTNQGWKDSETAIVDAEGRVVATPIAASELQGYWYAALRHGALAFAAAGDPRRAASMLREAAALRRRFHRAFWVPEDRCYALALGPDGEQVRSTNSNDGQLLATGIVPPAIAPVVARRLLEPDMFSGWGIRTLSADHPAYNPFSYHRGSVWPVEAGTIALGLARYGRVEELHRLAEATFSAATLFEQHRLPEALSGLPRDAAHPHPGTYPAACSPQAWSASTVVALVQALLGLRPAAPAHTFVVDPHLPSWLPDLTLYGVQLGGRTCDLHAQRRGGRTRVRVKNGDVHLVHARTLLSRRTGPEVKTEPEDGGLR